MIPPLAKLDWISFLSIFKPEILEIIFTYFYYWWLVGLVVLTNWEGGWKSGSPEL